ncbi:MAG: ABC transporter permease [Rhodothermales bacterium]
MLSGLFDHELTLGAVQAVVAAVLALAVALVARRQKIRLLGETGIALARGIVQIVVVGALLVVVFQGPLWTGVLVLAAMMGAAGAIAGKRAEGIPGAFRVSFYGIVGGAGLVILLMTLLGAIQPELTSMIPVGSMLIANSMNTAALSLERFRSEVTAHTGYVEAALALGADPNVAVRPYAQAAVTAGMIPRLDSLSSLGIVWIPGLMAGMIIAGGNPIYAAVYQFVVIAMIYAASGLTALVSTLLLRPGAFTAAEQLALRPSGTR